MNLIVWPSYSTIKHAGMRNQANWLKPLLETLSTLVEGNAQLANLIDAGFVRRTPKTLDGHVASGPTVAADKLFVDFLKKRDRSYLALEMEAAGIMHAVNEVSSSCQTAVLGGISDLADERKSKFDQIKDGVLRNYAMRNALDLLWNAMAVDTFIHGQY